MIEKLYVKVVSKRLLGDEMFASILRFFCAVYLAPIAPAPG
jgi:hypothetical protein